jgi:hypothetical protein
MRWAGHVALMGKMRSAYKILARKSQGKRLLGRPRRKRDIRIDSKKIGWEGVDWIHLPQDREQWQAVVNMVMNLQVP